ncbi:MAG TPA: hypothetical protein VNM48_22145, partial [Chloroflexota bacterium]|nr:hypothetical protein [Chloroflexota bacterium]
MRRREWARLAVILVIALTAGWIALPNNPGIHFSVGDRDVDIDFRTVLGLDLQGGLQVLLEADPPANLPVTGDTMTAA